MSSLRSQLTAHLDKLVNVRLISVLFGGALDTVPGIPAAIVSASLGVTI